MPVTDSPLLEVCGLTKDFTSGVFHRHTVHAVSDVSFSIRKGGTLGLAGDSGCGKSTVARMILSLIPPDAGTVRLDGAVISGIQQRRFQPYRRRMQLVFQHPESSLDPGKRILTSLLEPMEIHRLYTRPERRERISELLKLVGVSEGLLSRYPHQISGGEAQRLIIARALTLSPELLILDEPTSMLDVSIQAHIMNLLRDLQQRLNLTYLFISHDIEVIQWFCDEVAVMCGGQIVEQNSCDELLRNPQHPYTKRLIDSFLNW